MREKDVSRPEVMVEWVGEQAGTGIRDGNLGNNPKKHESSLMMKGG